MSNSQAAFEAVYDNGLAGAQWKTSQPGVVTGCELQLTDERMTLRHRRAHVGCPWGGIHVTAAPSSTDGSAVLTVRMQGDAGGQGRIALPHRSAHAFWAEVWRVAPVMRSAMSETISPRLIVGEAKTQMRYVGGYALHPKGDPVVDVVLDAYGVHVRSVPRGRELILIPWRDVLALGTEGALDPQRQRSLARTIGFGVLGGLGGKQVKSAYLSVVTSHGEAIFHTEKLTEPELRVRLSPALTNAQAAIVA